MGKIRILQVVGSMNIGGVETCLMHILRQLDRSRFQMDFLLFTDQECYHNAEIRSLGAKIITTPKPKSWRFPLSFRRLVKEYGPYDIIHLHPHFFINGYILFLALCLGIHVRIAHIHSDSSRSRIYARGGIFRRACMVVMPWLIKRLSTTGVAASQEAATALFGPDWRSDPRWRVLYCGLDLTPFAARVDCQQVRQEVGLSAKDYVVGHVGRFRKEKNHQFIADIAKKLTMADPAIRFLLVGDGPLRPTIEDQVREAGLRHRVIFTGARHDVPRLMLGAMDVFLLPSLYEGLGLVLVEAQAAGLPCVLSEVVPSEVDIVKPLITRLSLAKSAQEWSKEILSLKNFPLKISQTAALEIVEKSPFNIKYTEIMSFYQEISNYLDG